MKLIPRPRLIIGLVCLSLFCGCLTENTFARYRGWALKLEIPLYQGSPPAKCAYKSLGEMKGEYNKGLFENTGFAMSRALGVLANKARSAGANAVIKVEFKTVGRTFTYYGEAVIFDKLPD